MTSLGERGVGSVGPVTFLPELSRAERSFTFDLFRRPHRGAPRHVRGPHPARFLERAPRVQELDDGRQVWEYDGELFPNLGLNAVVGRPPAEPVRFDQMRGESGTFTPRSPIWISMESSHRSTSRRSLPASVPNKVQLNPDAFGQLPAHGRPRETCHHSNEPTIQRR